jgi:hypothetical protein
MGESSEYYLTSLGLETAGSVSRVGLLMSSFTALTGSRLR